MFESLKKMFGVRNSPEQSPDEKMFSIGYDALITARKLGATKNNETALQFYDIAIKNGFTEAYIDRAFILQILDYDLDAIEDFGHAFIMSPEDSNILFGRHLSKSKVGDCEGALEDIDQAVSLSKQPTELNGIYNSGIQKQGYNNITELYQMYLLKAQIEIDAPAFVKNKKKENQKRRI